MRKVTYQKVPCGWSECVVEAIAPDVDGKDDAADDVQKVEDSQVLRDRVVDGWRAGRGCVESGEKSCYDIHCEYEMSMTIDIVDEAQNICPLRSTC